MMQGTPTAWQYTDETKSVVTRTYQDGSIEACIATRDDVIASGTPLDPPAITDTELAHQIREQRNKYLSELDKVILRHRREKDLGVETKLTDAQFTQVLQIAQDLANLPEQQGFPEEVTWPTQPSWLVDPDGDE